jgi:hypothetical protein
MLFKPTEKIEAHEQPDDAQEVKLHLKADLELERAEVQIKRMGKPDAERNEIIGEECFCHVVLTGDEPDQGAQIGSDQDADDHDEYHGPKISFLQIDHSESFLS